MMPRLDVREAAKYIGCSKSLLDKLRVRGGGPTFIKVGRIVRYDDGDLDAWVAAQKRASTSDTGARRRAGGRG